MSENDAEEHVMEDSEEEQRIDHNNNTGNNNENVPASETEGVFQQPALVDSSLRHVPALLDVSNNNSRPDLLDTSSSPLSNHPATRPSSLFTTPDSAYSSPGSTSSSHHLSASFTFDSSAAMNGSGRSELDMPSTLVQPEDAADQLTENQRSEPSSKDGTEPSDRVLRSSVRDTSVERRKRRMDSESDTKDVLLSASKRKHHRRCGLEDCRKKLKVTAYPCRCGELYCDLHMGNHHCPYDYHKDAREQITKDNPKIEASKINKI